jgi:hypothetical protein
MRNWKIDIRRAALTMLAAPMAFVGGPLLGGAGIALVAGTAIVALPTDAGATIRGTARRTSRRTTVRHVAPGRAVRPVAPVVRSTARRTTRRTARRITRRHLYTMPVGYRVVPIGAYRYYYYSGLYYYPYYVSGRTTYVQVDVNVNNPVAPPSVGSISEEYYID